MSPKKVSTFTKTFPANSAQPTTSQPNIDKINEYFAKLNPIAEKIALDIEATKSAYEHFWNTLDMQEQIDIINETLIKPEISLRYFDKFSSSSSSSSSLAEPHESTQHDLKQKSATLTSQQKLTAKYVYQFDGKNLSSFQLQKVGIKQVHDEQFGDYHDEHSGPFNFKTKSQINLRLFQSEPNQKLLTSLTNYGEDEKVSISTILKYKKLNDELTASINSKNSKNNSDLSGLGDLNKSEKIDSKYERFKDDDDSAIEVNFSESDGNSGGKSNNFLSKFMSKNNLLFNSSPKAVIVPGVNDYESEDMVLMNNISYSGSGLTSSTSGEESIDDEEKTVCEDSKLLLVDNSEALRKGFDFLANW